jgi:hypothetical protein
VLGNRISALQVSWGPVTVDARQMLPRSHWDAHDSVFFCCHRRTNAWAAVFVTGRMESEPANQGCVNFFLACIKWNRRPPIVVLASLDGIDRATTMLLELQLEHIKFESWQRAERLIFSVFDGRVEAEVLQTGVGPVTCFRDPANQGSPVRNLRVDIREERQPEVCVSPVMVLELS